MSQPNHMFYKKVLQDQDVPKMINVVKGFLPFFLLEF